MRPRSPLFWASIAGLAVVLAAFLPVAWQVWRGGPARAAAGMGAEPWRIDRVSPGQVQAFGLRLPGATLADAKRLWPGELQLAVIASRERAAALEAYVERWSGGGLVGRLVLVADVDAPTLARWQGRAARRERVDAQAERWLLQVEDVDDALRRPVSGMSFLPSARVDGPTLVARLGAPAERLGGPDALQHWLYPDLGLAVAWQSDRGRAVLQVVAPAEFEARLRAPLQTPAAATASGPPR